MKNIISFLSCLMLLSAAPFHGGFEFQAENPAKTLETSPEQSFDTAMNALTELDLETFNRYTDNYIRTYRNWLGIPTEREYRILSELQQPGFVDKKRYQANKSTAEEMVCDLTWVITDSQIRDDKAALNVCITNTDFSDALGYCYIHNMEDSLSNSSFPFLRMLFVFNDFDYDKGVLLSEMEAADQTIDVNIKVFARLENDVWKIHLSEELIDILTGKLYSLDYSDEVIREIEELEEIEDLGDEYDYILDEQADDFLDSITF